MGLQSWTGLSDYHSTRSYGTNDRNINAKKAASVYSALSLAY